MRIKKYTDEENKARHVESVKRYQKKMLQVKRVEKLNRLVAEVLRLNEQGESCNAIATELERQGYIGTKKERR